MVVVSPERQPHDALEFLHGAGEFPWFDARLRCRTPPHPLFLWLMCGTVTRYFAEHYRLRHQQCSVPCRPPVALILPAIHQQITGTKPEFSTGQTAGAFRTDGTRSLSIKMHCTRRVFLKQFLGRPLPSHTWTKLTLTCRAIALVPWHLHPLDSLGLRLQSSLYRPCVPLQPIFFPTNPLSVPFFKHGFGLCFFTFSLSFPHSLSIFRVPGAFFAFRSNSATAWHNCWTLILNFITAQNQRTLRELQKITLQWPSYGNCWSARPPSLPLLLLHRLRSHPS